LGTLLGNQEIDKRTRRCIDAVPHITVLKAPASTPPLQLPPQTQLLVPLPKMAMNQRTYLRNALNAGEPGIGMWLT